MIDRRPGQDSVRRRVPVTCNQALGRIKDILSESKGIIGIGSPRASLETNFALRELVGPENFCSGMTRKEAWLVELILGILKNGPARSPSLREVAACDAVLVLGEDLTNTAPLLALAVRQAGRSGRSSMPAEQRIPLWDDAAVRNASQGMPGRVSIAAPYATKLDDIAAHCITAHPTTSPASALPSPMN